MIITISGKPGAGKTSVGKKLAKILDYTFYSIGDIRGKLATDRGLTIDELNKIGEGEKGDWTDRNVDDYQISLGKTGDNFIFEGRLSFYFIPHSKKVFLNVHPYIGAERIFNDMRPDEKQERTVEETQKKLEKRVQSDKLRYEKYYEIDPYNLMHYDLVIDTSDKTVEEVVQEILQVYFE